MTNYEILEGTDLKWIRSCNGEVPKGAILAGNTATNDPLYVGRVKLQGIYGTPGTVYCHHGRIYVPYSGLELDFVEYEVFCEEQNLLMKLLCGGKRLVMRLCPSLIIKFCV